MSRRLRYLRTAHLAGACFILGAISALLWVGGWPIGQADHMAVSRDTSPAGIGLSANGVSMAHYEAGRQRLELAAEFFHSDSWGCSWLTGGVELSFALDQVPLLTTELVHHEPPGNRGSSNGVGHQSLKERNLVHLRALSAAWVTDSATAAFAGGVTVTHSDGRSAIGDALLSVDGGYELRGTPARAWSNTWELFAPRIAFDPGSRIAIGDGGVTSISEDGSPIFGSSKTWVQAAQFSTSGQSISFFGDVRAWSGEDLLLAESITMNKEEVVATGAVRLTLRSLEGVEVRSRELRASRAELVFVGAVRGRDELGREAYCDILVIHMGHGEGLSSIECRGNASVSSVADGFQMTGGTLARYDHGLITIEGSPATVRTQGATISSRLISYDTVSGRLITGEGN